MPKAFDLSAFVPYAALNTASVMSARSFVQARAPFALSAGVAGSASAATGRIAATTHAVRRTLSFTGFPSDRLRNGFRQQRFTTRDADEGEIRRQKWKVCVRSR